MSEKLSQQMLRAIVDGEWIGAPRRLGEMWAMDVATLESELALLRRQKAFLETMLRAALPYVTHMDYSIALAIEIENALNGFLPEAESK